MALSYYVPTWPTISAAWEITTLTVSADPGLQMKLKRCVRRGPPEIETKPPTQSQTRCWKAWLYWETRNNAGTKLLNLGNLAWICPLPLSPMGQL